MVFPVHLQRSAVAAILDCHVWGQFSGPESLKPVALQLIWLFQESLVDASSLPTLAITWPQFAVGANKNHVEAAQVYGIVSLPPISSHGRPSLRPPTP
jgi:hypothetical protein